MRRTFRSTIPRKKIIHTLVVIGLLGNKTVYVDVPPKEAIKRYLKAKGDDPSTRHQVEAAEVLRITDQFEAYSVWHSPTRPRSEKT